MSIHTETAFEQVIETHLLHHGYRKLANKEFDTDRALFPKTAIAFIQKRNPRNGNASKNSTATTPPTKSSPTSENG